MTQAKSVLDRRGDARPSLIVPVIGKECTPRPARGLRTELLDDELLLYHQERTRVIALNPTASLIWSLCDGERSLAEVERLLVDAFPEAALRIPLDIEQAVASLVEEGALELAGVAAR